MSYSWMIKAVMQDELLDKTRSRMSISHPIECLFYYGQNGHSAPQFMA